jgi:hypothetical protein
VSESSSGDSPSSDPKADPEDHYLSIEDAAEWAAGFQAPASPGDIKELPRRRERVKRKAHKPATEAKAKRLKTYYNNEYRELLNVDIQDASRGMLNDDHYKFKPSQIGSSFWSAPEKYVFFQALDRLGRDDVRSIASRIQTKSEVEVQEYMLLLHRETKTRQLKGGPTLSHFDIPAAAEISEECCIILERAGDTIAIRQELAEEKVEKGKWGDSWLLTKDVSCWIETRRRQEGGEEEMEEVLPAANLLKSGNWLELSKEIFMNPAGSREEDNWRALAEPGETPAIRATAFEDFHSLAVDLTKRLVSTTLFCAMSRIRAKESRNVKRADVNPDDVEAAVNILGLKLNSNQFWVDCARRCNLAVMEDDDPDEDEAEELGSDQDEDAPMSYDAVEANLRTSRRSRSRSRSRSRQPRASTCTPLPDQLPEPPISDADDESSESSVYSSADEEIDASGTSKSDSEHHLSDLDLGPHNSSQERNPEKLKALESAHEKYTEAIDAHANKTEEVRLWNMLEQNAPFEIEIEPIDSLELPKPIKVAAMEADDWRNHMEYWSQWEKHEIPVAEESFVRNKKKLSREGKRKTALRQEDR